MSPVEAMIEAQGRVRPMARHDVPVVAALIARLCLVDHADHADHADRADRTAPPLDAAALEAGLRAPASRLHGLVAERFGYVVGYALLEADAAGEALDLRQLFVMEGSRGLGLGHRLVGAAADVARAAGCRRLVTRPPLASVHAPGFYAALGFQARGAAAATEYMRALP